MLCGLSLMFLYVWGRVDVGVKGYELDRLAKKKVELVHDRDLLQLRLSRLTSPERIAHEAGKLGMRAPTPGQIVLVALPSFPAGDGSKGNTPP